MQMKEWHSTRDLSAVRDRAMRILRGEHSELRGEHTGRLRSRNVLRSTGGPPRRPV